MAFRLAGDLDWSVALYNWKLGRPEKLVEMLQGDRPVPPYVRHWLAELALGKQKKWRGLTQRAVLQKDHSIRPVLQSRAVTLFDQLREGFASLRRQARAEGRDARALFTTEDAARMAIREAGLEVPEHAERTLNRWRAARRRPVGLLDYRRKG